MPLAAASSIKVAQRIGRLETYISGASFPLRPPFSTATFSSSCLLFSPVPGRRRRRKALDIVYFWRLYNRSSLNLVSDSSSPSLQQATEHSHFSILPRTRKFGPHCLVSRLPHFHIALLSSGPPTNLIVHGRDGRAHNLNFVSMAWTPTTRIAWRNSVTSLQRWCWLVPA